MYQKISQPHVEFCATKCRRRSGMEVKVRKTIRYNDCGKIQALFNTEKISGLFVGLSYFACHYDTGI